MRLILYILREQRGSGAVQFIIYSGLLAFLIFGSVDYWLIQQRVSHVEHIKQYYLDRVRLEGWLSSTDEAALVSRLSTAQYTNIQIDSTAREALGHARVLRNTGDLDGSEVYLDIQCEPTPQPFVFAQLIGAGAPGTFTIHVGGRALSERVDP